MEQIRLPQAAVLTSPNPVTKELHEVGDHYLYICEVEKVYGNEAEEALFAWNGYSKIAPELVSLHNPLKIFLVLLLTALFFIFCAQIVVIS